MARGKGYFENKEWNKQAQKSAPAIKPLLVPIRGMRRHLCVSLQSLSPSLFLSLSLSFSSLARGLTNGPLFRR